MPKLAEPIAALLPELNALRQQAERASAVGDHTTAVAAYSAALALLPHPVRSDARELAYDLLHARAVCYQRLSDYPAVEADLDVMAGIARELNDPMREMEVIAEQVQVAFPQGKAAAMRPAVEAMLNRARTAGDALLEAAALAALTEIGVWTSDYATARTYAEAALATFEAHDKRADAARIHHMLGMIASNTGALAAGLAHVETAVAIYHALGDRRNEARALNQMGNSSSDYAHQRDAYRQSLAICSEIGDRLGQGVVSSNVGTIYGELGLYGRAAAYLEESALLLRDMQAHMSIAVMFQSLGCLALERGAVEQAVALLDQGRTYSLAAADERQVTICTFWLGRAALVQGELEHAAELFEEAANRFATLDVQGERAAALAWLGAAAFQLGDLPAACTATAEATALIEIGAESIDLALQEVWWWRWRVLEAAPQPLPGEWGGESTLPSPRVGEGGGGGEGWLALDRACALMLKRIANLSDPGLRRNYLNKVAINRDIVLEWTRQARARECSLAPLLAYQAPEGSLQQQLTRMLETGTRLAAQRDPDALPQFIVDEFIELSGAEHTLFVRFPDATADAFDVVLAEGISDGEREHVLALARPLIGAAATTRQPVLRPAIGAVPDGDVPELHLRSALALPLVAQGTLQGVLYGDVRQIFGPFSQADLDLIALLGNQAAAALENANWSRTLERRVDERTAELQAANAALEQRNTELAIINSVQRGLAQQLDMQAMYDLVGDQIRDIFDAQVVGIDIYDVENNLIHHPYIIERGERFYIEPHSAVGIGLTAHMLRTRQSLIINSDLVQKAAEFGSYVLEGTEIAKSYLGVPLVVGDQGRGAITLENLDRENAFSEADLQLLSTLAASLSVAIENARLFEETRRLLAETEQRNAELATVNRIGKALASELELDALLELIGEQMRQTFAADIVYVALYNPQSGYIQFPYVYGEDLTPQRYGEGLTSHIIATGQPLLINEAVNQHEADLGVTPVGRDVLSYLGVPVVVGETAIGVISVQSTTQEGRFGESDVHLLSTVAANVGVAIQNAQLYEDIRRRASEMAALADVGREISASLELPTVLERIAAQAKDLLGANTSAVYLAEQGGRVFRATTVLGDDAKAIQADTVLLGQGIIGNLAGRGVAQIIHDSINDPRVRHIPGTTQQEAEQLMVAPLLAGTRVSGVMAVWRTGHSIAFTDNDLQFLTGLARQAAIAIENARLFQAAHDAQAAAEQANTAKSTFLANMSHELRTPLNAIIGFTRIVRRKAQGSLPDKQVDNLDKVLVSAEHLLGLINTVLDIAKIEAGRMDVQPVAFKATELVDVCSTTAQPLLRPFVSLTKAVEDGLPLLFSDPDKVKQILLNLLSNAAKFTHAGTITLRVSSKVAQSSAETQNRVLFEVSDTGVGISQEALERIFEEFQQADTSTTRKYGGTGLGLSISRHLARLLGGDLTASSTEGVGSTFSLILPVHYGEPLTRTETTQPEVVTHAHWKPEQPVVLAIDDDPDAIELLHENLTDAGYQVVGVRSGSEGVQKAKELRPYAITLDIMMPHKDGWQVLYELKADPATRDIPVILVTIVDKKALGYQLGANDYLVKPLDREALLAALGRIAQSSGQIGPTYVLVVDDDPDVIDMVRQQLAETSYELDTAADGIAALEAIARRQPDVVLLDLMLPRLDGFGVIEHLRRQATLASIPVVVLTAKTLSSEEAALLRASVSQVIQKQGLEGEKLLGELQRALQHSAASY